jgi:hypothetical protein
MSIQRGNPWIWAAIAAGVNGWHSTNVLALVANIRRNNGSHRS